MVDNSDRGFVALMSVLVISAVLLTALITLGAASYFNRFNTLDAENKRISLALAEACGNAAMLKLAQDQNYKPVAGGECVSVSDTCGAAGAQRICKICSVGSLGDETVIWVRAAYGYANVTAYTNIRITGTMGATNFSVTTWREMPAYSGPSCAIP